MIKYYRTRIELNSNSDSDSDSDSDNSESTSEDKDMIKRLYNEFIQSNINTQDLTCVHKKKQPKCKIYANCCDKIFPCIKCHNEYFINMQPHTVTQKDIVHIMCNACECIQPISNMCSTCETLFSRYHCDTCKIYSDSDAFHCEKCDMCIIGNEYEYKHCNTCNCCIEINKYEDHKCMINRLDSNCPICLDDQKSDKKIVILKCGHSLHEECKNELFLITYKCPMCFKTVKDMTNEFRQIDNQISCEPYPYKKIVEIKCNDCLCTSKIFYHPLGLKCKTCYSYNTYISN
jgi:RING finger/CHY zinc finger protein 1